MKTLIVYYSFEGNTKFVAKAIAERIGGDLLELRCGNEPPRRGFLKYLVGGKDALTGAKMNLYRFELHPEDYDLILIGAPVWAGKLPPALREFVLQHPFSEQRTAIFATSDSGNAKRMLGILRTLLAGNEVLAEMSLQKPINNPEKMHEQIGKFLRKISYAFDKSEDRAYLRADYAADETIREVAVDLSEMVRGELGR